MILDFDVRWCQHDVMNLDQYVETVRAGVTNAAALADEQTQSLAARLGATIDSSTRLALIEALSDAAGVISAELAPGSVELRMAGNEPQFVVQAAQPGGEPTMLMPDREPGEEPTRTVRDQRRRAGRADQPAAAGIGEDPGRGAGRRGAHLDQRLAGQGDHHGRRTSAGHPAAARRPPPRPGELGGIFGPERTVRSERGLRPGRSVRRTQSRSAPRRPGTSSAAQAKTEGWKSAHGVQGWVR